MLLKKKYIIFLKNNKNLIKQINNNYIYFQIKYIKLFYNNNKIILKLNKNIFKNKWIIENKTKNKLVINLIQILFYAK